MCRGRSLAALLVATWICVVNSGHAQVPNYKLGDVATEDVITPVPLLVVNPEATEALKAKVAQQVDFIVRLTPQSASEAETELRNSIITARANFIATLQLALQGRAPAETDLASPVFAKAIRDVARESPKDLPLDKLAVLWVRGESDAVLVESMLRPLREAMAQPIVTSRSNNTFPTGKLVRLVSVRSDAEIPPIQEVEGPGPTISPGKVIALWRAKRLVETSFPPGQEELGKFAASFVRANAYPDAGLTEVLRARRMEGVTVNDTYEAAQTIVRKGQTIDRKALSALTAMREKSLIGTLQTKLEQEQVVAGQINQQTKWIVTSLVAGCIALLFILWRLRARPSGALMTLPDNPELAGGTTQPMLGDAGENAWQQRALLAEEKAARAQEAVRTGALSWMREKIFRTLSRHRTELLSAQQKAELEMRELEQRLEQLHTPLQERIGAYERRIEELERDLAAKGEENRQLISARISVAKEQLILERKRGGFGTN
jgi:hypothetical protein